MRRSDNLFARRFVFHPATVLAVSALAALVFVLALLPLPRFSGERRGYLYAYHAPIAAVFVVLLFDRAARWRSIAPAQWAIEAVVVGVSLLRAVLGFPPISGHALFLSYILGTSPFRLLWWAAAVVFVEVVYIKIAVLGDPTLFGGVACGVLAGLLWRWLGLARARHVGWLPGEGLCEHNNE